MEEFIRYFYKLSIDKINKKDNKYLIESNKKKYQLIDYKSDPNILYKNYINFKNNGVCCHDIIINKDKNILSIYDNKNYLLLKENIDSVENISLDEIINSNLIINYNQEISLKSRWEQKNDYYESIIDNISLENEYILESFDYYLGLSELSISLLNYVNFNNVKYYAQHNRLKYNETIEDFYNPINMLIDTRARDIALYIKSNFFNNNIDSEQVKNILNKLNFNNDEIILLVCRLIYPDYYFDILDEIINENMNNDKIKECINKNTSYEAFLKKIYNYLYYIYDIPKIEFLIQ